MEFVKGCCGVDGVREGMLSDPVTVTEFKLSNSRDFNSSLVIINIIT